MVQEQRRHPSYPHVLPLSAREKEEPRTERISGTPNMLSTQEWRRVKDLNFQDTISLIQATIAPGVLISSCALLCLVIQTRYGRVIDRIKVFNQEHSSLTTNKSSSKYDMDSKKRIDDLKTQVTMLMKRGNYLKLSLFGLFFQYFGLHLDIFSGVFCVRSKPFRDRFTCHRYFLCRPSITDRWSAICSQRSRRFIRCRCPRSRKRTILTSKSTSSTCKHARRAVLLVRR